MGQYYRPAVLKHTWKKNKKPVKASLYCYDYNDCGWFIGAKLMEHSYVGNPLVQDVEELLGTKYKGYPFVWVGDYADDVEINGEEKSIYVEADKFIYKDYDSDSSEKQSWAEQAKMRANKTAASYNEYILKNSFVWDGNIPKDISGKLEYIQ